jgi:hypothetical protein
MKNCRGISFEDKIAFCEKTARLRSGHFSYLNSACLKVLVPVHAFFLLFKFNYIKFDLSQYIYKQTRLITDTSIENEKIQHRCDRRDEQDLRPN